MPTVCNAKYDYPTPLAVVLLTVRVPRRLFGMLLWGIGYAIQDTLLKALVAEVLPEGQRNLAFGLFYAGYGVGWLIGSIAIGLLYDQSRAGLIVFAIVAQLASLPVFVMAQRRQAIS